MAVKKLFDVIFQGELVEGADLVAVKNNVASLFKADVASLEKLFTGKRFVIKGNLDEQTALKYQHAMKNAGAICQVSEKDAGFAGISPELASVTIAAPGVILDENRPAQAPDIDISTLDILALGVDVQDAPEAVSQRAAPVPIEADIAPPGEILVEPQAVVTPEYHIEGLSIAERGTDLVDSTKKVAVATLPDTSQLTLAPFDPADQDDNPASSYLKSLGLDSDPA